MRLLFARLLTLCRLPAARVLSAACTGSLIKSTRGHALLYLHTSNHAVSQARLLDSQEGANAERYVFGMLSARCSQRRAFRYRHYSNCGDIDHGAANALRWTSRRQGVWWGAAAAQHWWRKRYTGMLLKKVGGCSCGSAAAKVLRRKSSSWEGCLVTGHQNPPHVQ